MFKKRLPSVIMDNLGIIIGAIIGILIFIFGLVKILSLILVVAVCMFAGYVIQKNKFNIKETLKSFIDKI